MRNTPHKKTTVSILLIALLVALLLPVAGIHPAFAKDDIQVLFSKGLQKQNEGDWIAAIYVFQDVLSRNRYFIEAKIELARCYHETGNLAEARTLLEEALKQEKNNLRARNLLGRVYISMRQYQDAEGMFRSTLKMEPANIEAKYGLADLYRVKGDYKRAIGIYEEVLKLYPSEVRTYIHLGNCYAEMGELDRAGGFFRKAVSLDSQSLYTHLNLARYYYKMGVRYSPSGRPAAPIEVAVSDDAAQKFFDAALIETRTAIEVEGTSIEPYRAAAAVHFFRKDYGKALEAYAAIRRLLEKRTSPAGGDQAGSLLLYETGFCREMTGDLRGAETEYAAALAKRIDDEVTRFRLEKVRLTLHRESLSEPSRVEMSDAHYEKARFSFERNLMDKAAVQFTRAIQLDPKSARKRQDLAEIYRIRGFYELYVFELSAILRDTLGVKSTDLEDRIDIYKSRTANSLASRWGVSQYSMDETAGYGSSTGGAGGSSGNGAVGDAEGVAGVGVSGYFPRTRTRVAVFDAFSSNYITEDFLHRRLSKTFREMLSLQLAAGADRGAPAYPKIEVLNFEDRVESREAAMKKALEAGADYYATGSLVEGEDSLRVRAELLSGFNGKTVERFDAYYTGNDKIFNAVFSVAESINQALPLVGQIARLRGNDLALINMGVAHGVKKEMSFRIYRKGGLKKSPETGEYVEDPETSLGMLTVTAVDETVAEGTYTYNGIHNRVNVYDSVVLVKEGEAEGSPQKER